MYSTASPNVPVFCSHAIENPSGGVEEYTTDASTLNKAYYLKHDVVDNIITASYVCFVTDTEHCLRGGDGGASYTANVGVLQEQQTWFTSHSGSCSLNPSGSISYCNGGPFASAHADSDDYVSVIDTDEAICCVDNGGNSYCY